MTGNIQKLSVRLLKEGLQPEDSVREGVHLAAWPKLEGAKIALDTMGGHAPKWSKFLELSNEEKAKLKNSTAYGLVFVNAAGRWFAVSFGMGHVKLEPACFQQDFGLRVVLNSVDPKQLKSADLRTPDENTLSRRSQTSRGSDQTAFAIDVERDIVRGLAGKPRDAKFATRVAGTDSLSMDRRMTVADLPAACADAYKLYQKDDYKKDFGWIDHIRHVRESAIIEKLEHALVAAIDAAVKSGQSDDLHLAFPIIYNPERASLIRYKGFRSNNLYPDLDFPGYLDALRERGKDEYKREDLHGHMVHEVDDAGSDCGDKWRISECLVFETELDGHTYVLSGDRWYQIDVDLAKEVHDFFANVDRVELPAAEADDNEEKYNNRLKANEPDLLCLDRKLVTPSGAASAIEVCDFLGRDNRLIHVKDKTSSSRLSHLFSQGTVSGRILILDGGARDRLRDKVTAVQEETGQSDFDDIICGADSEFRASDFTVVYAVLSTGDVAKLPFFSLVTFRQAARELKLLGYRYAFSWIEKPASTAAKKKKKASAGEGEDETADVAAAETVAA